MTQPETRTESSEGASISPVEVHENWLKDHFPNLVIGGTYVGVGIVEASIGLSNQIQHVIETAQRLGEPLISSGTLHRLANSFNLNEAASLVLVISGGAILGHTLGEAIELEEQRPTGSSQ